MSNGGLKRVVSVPRYWLCQREPCRTILSMNDHRSRIVILPINQQEDHLAITGIRPMMGAWTVGVSQPGNVQIECLHYAKASAGQLLVDPSLSLLACLVKNQKGD